MTTESSSAPPWRWWRAGVFAIAMTSLAAFAHLVAGGHLPGIGTVVLGGLLVSCLTYPLAHRERRLPVVVAATVAAQAILHIFFDATMSAVHSGNTGSTLMHGMAMSPASVPGDSGPTALPGLVPITPAMLVMHAVAAVVVAVGLRTGERAFFDVAARLRSLLEHVLVVFAPAPELAPPAGPLSRGLSLRAPVGFAAPGLSHSIDGRAPPRGQTR